MRQKIESTRMPVNLPIDVRDWLEREAEQTLSPMNSIVIAALRQRMDERRAADATER